MMQRLLQFTLDLFESAPVASAAEPANAEKSPDFVEKKPITKNRQAQTAIETIATATPATPATFAHPRATRQAWLNNTLVAYEFRRSKRRSIGFSVGASGLAVSAPKWVPLSDIDQAVLEKSGWILQKLQQTREHHERLESARIDWQDGATLPFLGEPLTVVIDPRHAFAGVGAELKPGAAEVRTLQLGLPRSATPEQIREAVQAWLMRQVRQIFAERLAHFAPQLGVQWSKFSLSSAGTRWGSASANGSIRLNWRLVHFKPPVLDYVVVHELSHLRVMDHSPRFWDTVREVMPDYAALRGQLKDEAIPRW